MPESRSRSFLYHTGKLGVRVICLARLNGLAWALSQVRKSSQSQGAVPLDCSESARRGEANKTLERTRQFYGECRKLGRETRALWVPYESIKDGSPRQRTALASVLSFLSLDPEAKLGADTPHFSPGASSAYVANADECRATLAPSPYLRDMLDDPKFPYGAVDRAARKRARFGAAAERRTADDARRSMPRG